MNTTVDLEHPPELEPLKSRKLKRELFKMNGRINVKLLSLQGALGSKTMDEKVARYLLHHVMQDTELGSLVMRVDNLISRSNLDMIARMRGGLNPRKGTEEAYFEVVYRSELSEEKNDPGVFTHLKLELSELRNFCITEDEIDEVNQRINDENKD